MVELLRNRVPRRGRGKKGLDAAHLSVFSLLHRVPLLRAGDPRMGGLELDLADSHMI